MILATLFVLPPKRSPLTPFQVENKIYIQKILQGRPAVRRAVKRPDKIPVPKRVASSTEMRYKFASMNKPVPLGKKDEIRKSFENALSQNELGIVDFSKTKQKGKFKTRGGKAHGGACKAPSCLVVPKKDGATPPCLHKFFHCICYKQKLISLMESTDYKCSRADVSREDNFLACKTFHTGTTLSGTGEDNYRFTKCLGEVHENGEIDVASSIWHIERVVNGKRLLLLPREARDDDVVWVDFERLSLFAQRHSIRVLVYEMLRNSDDDFHGFQRILEEFENLSLEKSTVKEQILFAKFKKMLIGKIPAVPARNIKLCGKSGKSLAVEQKVVVKKDKNGKPVQWKITYPNWEKEYSNFKKLGGELLLETKDVERLCKLGAIPKTGKERDWVKARNCMKCCLPKINGKAQCSNFQNPLKAGICWECLLNTMDWTGHEESFDSNRRGWKEWESKYASWKASLPKGADDSEIAFRVSGNEPNRILFHSCRDHGKGHFHSIAIAIRLVDLETEKLHLKLDWNIKSIWDNLKLRFSEINSGASQRLQKYKCTPGKASDVRAQSSMKTANEEASYFLLNMTNSLIFAMTHFVYDVPGTDFSVPLCCDSFEFTVPFKKAIKRSSSLRGQERGFLTVFANKTWKKPGPGAPKPLENLVIGDATYAMCDVACDFSHGNFFVAASNPLFTVLMPEHFDICMRGSPCVNVRKGDLISFDGKMIWWMHEDDEFGIFDGVMKIARMCDSEIHPPTFVKNIYQTPDKIYFVDGKVKEWCEKPYCYEENGYLMFAEKVVDTKKFCITPSKVPELIPFEIKLLFLSMDHRHNVDVFDESLKNAHLFEDDGEYYDLKNSIKQTFVKLGYNCHEAGARGKKLPNKHVQQFYLTCAIEHVMQKKSSVIVSKNDLNQYFPSDSSKFLEISVDENQVVSARDLSGDHSSLRFYPSCRVNTKKDGKHWKRSYHDGISFNNKHGNFYKFYKYKPEVFDSMKSSLSGSKDIFEKSKCFFPSTKTGWAPKGEIDFLSSFELIPKVKYGSESCAFTNLLRPTFELPSFVYHGEKPVVLDAVQDDAIDQVDDFIMDLDSDEDPTFDI